MRLLYEIIKLTFDENAAATKDCQMPRGFESLTVSAFCPDFVIRNLLNEINQLWEKRPSEHEEKPEENFRLHFHLFTFNFHVTPQHTITTTHVRNQSINRKITSGLRKTRDLGNARWWSTQNFHEHCPPNYNIKLMRFVSVRGRGGVVIGGPWGPWGRRLGGGCPFRRTNEPDCNSVGFYQLDPHYPARGSLYFNAICSSARMRHENHLFGITNAKKWWQYWHKNWHEIRPRRTYQTKRTEP